MHYYEVAPNRIVRPGSDVFTYHSEARYEPGHIVHVAVGSKRMIGMIIKRVEQPTYQTKPIEGLIETTPLPSALVQTALWLAEYYATPLATVLQTILPRGVDKNRRNINRQPSSHKRNRTKIVFNRDQRRALQIIDGLPAGTALLHGVTGSGKTAIYREVAKQVVGDGRSVIIVVPEIALTSQLVAEFSQDFDDIILTHSLLLL